MNRNAVVQDVIFRALESLNEELPEGSKVPVGLDTLLLGPQAPLDSLSLVSVIVDVEAGLEQKFGRPVSLTDDRAMSQDASPFTNVRSLAAYIVQLLGEPD